MRGKVFVILSLAAALLFFTGCEGGESALVKQYQPLGEAFVTEYIAGDFDGTHAQFSDNMKLNVTRKRWEDEIHPQLLEYGGEIRSVRFVSAYPINGGAETKLWLHLKQKNNLVTYCIVFDAENRITDFTFR